MLIEGVQAQERSCQVTAAVIYRRADESLIKVVTKEMERKERAQAIFKQNYDT